MRILVQRQKLLTSIETILNMPRIFGTGITLPLRRLMIFVDGGYLREGIRRIFRDEEMDEKINYGKLRDSIVERTASQGIRPELIRAYYYDAQVAQNDGKFEEQEKYFRKIRSRKFYEIRLGRLIKTNGGYRQKGVDILIAVDMLTKGYLKHYDIAAFLGGDDDFVDLISAVKNLAGRRIFGFFYSYNVSKRLQRCFDVEFKLTKEQVRSFLETSE